MSEQELPEEMQGHAAFLLWQREKQQQLAAEMESEHSAFLSEFAHFLSELTIEQTRTLRTMIERSSDPHVRIELAGLTIGSQVFLQGLTVEGKDANEEWAKLQERDELDRSNPVPKLEGIDPNPPEPDPEVGQPDDPSVLMTEYNLEQDFTPGGKSKGFKCMMCGKNYSTIEDRIETEIRFAGCLGCQHKERWG
ncbi:hypothetical protein BH766_gp56 [Gordonia phage Demosthenes]|uniref:Uncharacterized protein n=1 Tax=Gordonia phage Demosthenes TaxID=1838067 RepID=A0A160DDW5_9CAUD|nr:hypothetical protein BH766_gp56 [Gordonia phage Demosthenes]ANA86026.1 hypothetical protein PBI_DEMOSTHENES_56 [Gordonia phage Demosthenes]